MMSKKQLEMILARLAVFERPRLKLEQYSTDAGNAAFLVHHAAVCGDVKDKIIVDLGAGTGILALGTLFYSPAEVHLVDTDREALDIARENLKQLQQEFSLPHQNVFFHCVDVQKFYRKGHTVIMNPPFGKFRKGIDRLFLSKAFSISDVIHTFTNTGSQPFVEAFAREHGFCITHHQDREMMLPHSFKHHSRRLFRQKVDYYRLEKVMKKASS